MLAIFPLIAIATEMLHEANGQGFFFVYPFWEGFLETREFVEELVELLIWCQHEMIIFLFVGEAFLLVALAFFLSFFLVFFFLVIGGRAATTIKRAS